MRTQSDTGTAQAYQNARQAFGEQESAIGGGNVPLGSGTIAGINANLASQFDQQQSNQQLGITQANYAQGLQNFNNAAGALGGVASQYAPNQTASAALGAGGQAFGSADTINQQNLQAQQGLLGLAGGVLGDITGGLGNLDATGSSTGGEQVKNFFTGL